MYFKIALSLAKAGYEVVVAGTDKAPPPQQIPANVQIKMYPQFSRSLQNRLLRIGELWRLCQSERPNILMVHTAELLPLAVAHKLLHPQVKLVFDVLEDYEQNLRYHPFMRGWKKHLAALAIKYVQRLLVPFFEAVFYAEKCYDNVLHVADKRKYFLLNRFSPRATENETRTTLPDLPPLPYMLCCGTLNRSWGVFRSLSLWEKLNEISPLHLVVAGFTYDETVVPEILAFVSKSAYKERFTLVGGMQYVPYPVITYYIQHCAFGMALYDLPPSIRGKIPTKFYEFLAFKKPLLFTQDAYWDQLNREWLLGVSVSADKSVAEIWEELQNYQPQADNEKVYSWEANEEKVLWEVIETLRKGK